MSESEHSYIHDDQAGHRISQDSRYEEESQSRYDDDDEPYEEEDPEDDREIRSKSVNRPGSEQQREMEHDRKANQLYDDSEGSQMWEEESLEPDDVTKNSHQPIQNPKPSAFMLKESTLKYAAMPKSNGQSRSESRTSYSEPGAHFGVCL